MSPASLCVGGWARTEVAEMLQATVRAKARLCMVGKGLTLKIVQYTKPLPRDQISAERLDHGLPPLKKSQ